MDVYPSVTPINFGCQAGQISHFLVPSDSKGSAILKTLLDRSTTNGVNQRPALQGSIVRTVPHSDGQAKAGHVSSWIAVRRD
jgi:hypothetical protein